MKITIRIVALAASATAAATVALAPAADEARRRADRPEMS